MLKSTLGAALIGLGLLAPTTAGLAATAEDYDVADIIITDEMKAEGERFGGFPNSQAFNNETKCRAVTALFAQPRMGPTNPQMQAFLRYSKISLMILDVSVGVDPNKEPLIERMTTEIWRAIPAVVPGYCRSHPNDKLLLALVQSYNAARVSIGLPAM